MKAHYMIIATILPALCMAAIPVAWTNTPGMPTYALPNVPHGVPIDFSVTLKGYTPIADGADVRLWFQTNGMGKEWWSAPATHNGNVITATFGPAQDCGADRVNLFFGAPSNVFASAVLRLTPSPGFAPNSLPLPAPILDFSTVDVRNIGALTNGWSFGTATDLSPATNYTARSISSFAVTGTVARASSYGTPTRWADATGCVWEATAHKAPWFGGPGSTLLWDEEAKGWISENGQDLLTWDAGTWYLACGTWTVSLSCIGDQDAMRLVLHSESPVPDVILERGLLTNLITRVAYTNDIPDETDPTVPEWAKEPSPPSYSAADVGAAPASIVPVLTTVSNAAETAKLNAETALRIVLGESVWFAVTNYMRTVEGVIPSLQLWEVRDSATNLVYDSREEITNTVRVLTSELRAELEARIPSKAWGNYQSDGTDNPQPGDVAIVNQPTVVLTGGGTFNKYVEVGDSSVWVLQSSGPVSFGGNTNGNFFAVLDDEGNAHFRVAKTDSYDLPAFISDVLPRQPQNHILIYTATTNRHGNAVSEHPTLSVCSDLKDSLWYEEVEGEIDALGISVSWARDDTIPAWVATVTPDTYPPHLFFRCKVKQEGGVAVINTAPTRFDGGIQIGNGTYRLVPYPSGGKTYLTVEGMP